MAHVWNVECGHGHGHGHGAPASRNCLVPIRKRRHAWADAHAHAHARAYMRGPMHKRASRVRNPQVVFDMHASTISFVNTDCAALTPETASLQGGFAFQPCERGSS